MFTLSWLYKSSSANASLVQLEAYCALVSSQEVVCLRARSNLPSVLLVGPIVLYPLPYHLALVPSACMLLRLYPNLSYPLLYYISLLFVLYPKSIIPISKILSDYETYLISTIRL